MGQLGRIIRNFITEEDGVGSVEAILILVVLVGIVLIFKNQITKLVNNIWKSITQQSKSVTGMGGAGLSLAHAQLARSLGGICRPV